jgi:hypothetical protein
VVRLKEVTRRILLGITQVNKMYPVAEFPHHLGQVIILSHPKRPRTEA